MFIKERNYCAYAYRKETLSAYEFRKVLRFGISAPQAIQFVTRIIIGLERVKTFTTNSTGVAGQR